MLDADDGEGNPVFYIVNEYQNVVAVDIQANPKCPEWVELTQKTCDEGKVVAVASLLGTTPQTIAFIIDNLARLRASVEVDLGDLFEKIEECEKANAQYRGLIHQQNVTTHSLHSSLREQEKRIAELEHSQRLLNNMVQRTLRLFTG